MDMNDKELLKIINMKFDELFYEDNSEFGTDDSRRMPEEDCDEDIDNTVVFNDEDENVLKFGFLNLIKYNGEKFVVLFSSGDDDHEGVILRLEENNSDDAEFYASIDDERISKAVFALFNKKFQYGFSFV